jgi:5-hydroxyisourate hydrolase-like protein (transthyretin family)
MGGGDCGYAFDVGGEYLIYAYRHPQNGRLSTGICSRTRPLSTAGEDLKYLRGPAREASTRARIFGRIERVDDPVGDAWPLPRAPLSGVLVTATSDQQVYRARTQADGSYEMPVLAGQYRVVFEVAEELYVYGPVTTEVKDLRGCAEVGVAARWNGRVAGRVVTAQGDPVPGIAVALVAATAPNRSAFNSSLQVRTDGEGRYEISRVPSGVYRLSFDSWRSDRDRPEVRRSILQDASSAFTLQVPRGERITAPDLLLPAALQLVQVSGVVLNPAGGPATGAKVYLKNDSNSSYPLPPGAKTDKDGRFLMTVFAGRRYRLEAEGYADGRYSSRAELPGFEAKDDLKSLTIQLKPLKQGGS